MRPALSTPTSDALSRACWFWLRSIIAFAAVCLSLAQTAGAAQQAADAINQDMVFVQESAGETPEGLTAAAAWALFQRGAFAPIASRGMAASNFGLQASAFWLAVPVAKLAERTAPSQSGWVLEVDYPPLDRVDVFAMDGNGNPLDWQLSGDKLPFDQRSISYRSHAFALKADLPSQGVILIRVQTTGVASMPLLLHSARAFNERVQSSYALLAMYFGLVLGLAAYNALLFVQLRDSRFGWYVGLAASLTTLQAGLTGMGMQFIWPNATDWQSLAVATSIPIASVCASQFTRVFLNTPKTMPLVNIALLICLAYAVLSSGVAFVTPLSQSTYINSVGASATILAIFAAGFNGMFKRVDGAAFFLVAWLTMLMGGVALILHNNAWLPTNTITHHGLLIGSAMEMVLLSLALGNSVRVAHADRAAAVSLAEKEHLLADDLRASQSRNMGLLAERDALLNNAVVGMVLSVKRTHTWVNDKFAEMMGFERDYMIGRKADYLYADPTEWETFGAASRMELQTQGSFSREVCLRRRNGTVMWAHMVGACMRPGDVDAGVIWTILDVTAMRVSEEQTRAALAEQRQLTEARERFVAMTSHELRTPVAGILGTLELFEHYGDRLGELEKADMLKQINVSAHRLWDMTERVLLHGKAESGQLRFVPSATQLSDVINELTFEFCTDPKHPRERLEVLMSELPERLLLDSSMLRHIITNLLSNAFKYSPGGQSVRLAISIAPMPDGDPAARELRIVISDEGIGIPEGETGSLFNSFQRASNVGDISGTGLGLSIVKHCVDAHGGSIDVRTAVGTGSEFTVSLPTRLI